MPVDRVLRRFLVSAALVCLGARLAGASFVEFESGGVRPLALSPDGTHLYACNTPDGRLEIFDVTAGVTHVGSVAVGMEPVAVAARTNGEVWVVNHLSDSVSVVDVASNPPRVTRTLLVGDEPRDIVFGGPGATKNLAFITTAHRGQNSGVPLSDLTTDVHGTTHFGRADVWVFNAANLATDTTLGGTPVTVINLFTDTPRALAVSADGSTVYAAGFHTGNQTTTINEQAVCNGGSGAGTCTVSGSLMPGGLPAPNDDNNAVTGPETGLIVQFQNSGPNINKWVDRLGRNWTPAVRFSLPDLDVFKINANASPPVESANFAHVGTVLFNMVVSPTNANKVYVSNTDAHNEVRFEGLATRGFTSVRGHLAEARITVINGSTVTPHHLNPHLEPYTVAAIPNSGTADDSLATPVQMVLNGAGTTLYVAAFGSSAVGIFDVAQLEAGTFTPSATDHIITTGGGPSGLALDEPNHRLFALTRFDDSISVLDTNTRLETLHVPLHNPEPTSVVQGRPFLYDALATSANGEASCSSCHIFGDFDSLAWDLGNPDDVVLNNPNPIEFNIGQNPNFHPLKGPMTTQSLRGMANAGPMHWRGDRTGGNDPGGDALAEDQAFKKFIIAFKGLLGRSGPIADADMQKFTDFILQVTYPPNPNRNLDDTLSAGDQQSGHDLFFSSTTMSGRLTDTVRDCNGCHRLDPANGFFGTRGFTSFENETQMVKIPHLRNLYQKVGMFGLIKVPAFSDGDSTSRGIQVRGFGFLHDGSVDTLRRFHGASVFSLTTTERDQLQQFMMIFDTNLKPIVGQEVTLLHDGSSADNSTAVTPRITGLLIPQAAAGNCDLIVKGTVAGEQRGWYRTAGGIFQSDRAAQTFTDAQLRALATTAGQQLTYTAVPPGSGLRMGVDRDEDGYFDRDEIDAGSDPADPSSIPGATTTTSTSSSTSTSNSVPTTTSTSIPTTTSTSTSSTSSSSSTSTSSSSTTSTTILVGQSILGKKLLVRDPQPNVNPALRKIVLLAKETFSPNTIIGNPIANGATLSLTLNGTDPSAQGFVLPAGPLWRALGTIGFKYSDPDGVSGPVKVVIIKRTTAGLFLLKAIAKGAGIAVTPPNTGTNAQATLAIGSGDRYCTSFGGAAGGTVNPNDDQTFQVRNPSAEVPCP